MNQVAALYVDPRGPYPELLGAGACWDEPRDARRYEGPHPVVAHPPCQLWGPFAAINFKRWGGEHNRPGNDGGCFEAALRSVWAFGGVLEHPAFSRAWSAFSLPRPVGLGWRKVGDDWVCEVWQSAYGHKAQKRTWLLYRGFRKPRELRWERPRGTHQCGFHDQRGKARNKPTLGKREASMTPPDFARLLVSLAIESRGVS